MTKKPLMQQYLEYVADTEPDMRFHRWSFMTGVGALLGRGTFLPFGHWNVYPTLYTILIGRPGDRKSTAIKLAGKLFRAAGYSHFAAARTTKEKFLLDLEGKEVDPDVKDIDELSFYDEDAPREVWICADEFMDFIGINNMNFVTTLGVLWDWDEGAYEDKVKNSKSVRIKDPTVSVLGGITPQNFALTFPPDILGQGFFSRILLIHGDRTARRITIPKAPDTNLKDDLLVRLRELPTIVSGPIKLDDNAYNILDDIYKNDLGVNFNDSRFDSYIQRRNSHLLKLSTLITAMNESRIMLPEHVIEANTVLAFAEHFMPQALGEFGKSKNSSVANKVIDVLNQAAQEGRILKWSEMYAAVSQDVDKPEIFQQILAGLVTAGKVRAADSGAGREQGFLPIRRVANFDDLKYVELSFLTAEERAEVT